jgi:hypothetical protein
MLDGRCAAKEASLGPNVGTVAVSPERLLFATNGRSDLHSPNGFKGSIVSLEKRKLEA